MMRTKLQTATLIAAIGAMAACDRADKVPDPAPVRYRCGHGTAKGGLNRGGEKGGDRTLAIHTAVEGSAVG